MDMPQNNAAPGEAAPLLLRMLTAAAALGLGVGLYFALAYAGADSVQGNVQRLFYTHLPSFTGAAVAFALTFVGGLLYLFLRQERWEMLAVAAAEVGLALALINVALGSIWARPIWNTWWTGDPRMTSSAVMVLICVAYLLLRQGVANPNWRRWLSALMAVLLMAVMLFSILVVRTRTDTIHPVVIGAGAQSTSGGFRMAASMTAALIVNLIVWAGLLTPALVWWRVRLERAGRRPERAY